MWVLKDLKTRWPKVLPLVTFTDNRAVITLSQLEVVRKYCRLLTAERLKRTSWNADGPTSRTDVDVLPTRTTSVLFSGRANGEQFAFDMDPTCRQPLK